MYGSQSNQSKWIGPDQERIMDPRVGHGVGLGARDHGPSPSRKDGSQDLQTFGL